MEHNNDMYPARVAVPWEANALATWMTSVEERLDWIIRAITNKETAPVGEAQGRDAEVKAIAKELYSLQEKSIEERRACKK